MRSGTSRLRKDAVVSVLLLPPTLLILAAIAEASDSPMRFDSTVTPRTWTLTYWSVSLNCIVVAILPIFAGLVTIKAVWQQTRQLFDLNFLLLAAGAFGILSMAMALYHLSQRHVDSRFYYYGMFSDTTGSVAATVFASLVFGLCVLGFGVIYSSGVIPQGSGKYDRRADEPDPMGQLINERLSERSSTP
jgi:hypothetical protein